jgi:hypothetical protein
MANPGAGGGGLFAIIRSRAHVKVAATSSSPQSPKLVENLLRTSERAQTRSKCGFRLMTQEAACERVGSEEAMPRMVSVPSPISTQTRIWLVICSRIASQAEKGGFETYAEVLISKAKRCDKTAHHLAIVN